MSFFSNILYLFRKEKKSSAPESQLQDQVVPTSQDPETCPVCWGFQEYDSKIREKYRDKRIDVKNHVGSYLKSKRFQVENIDGLRYRKPTIKECPKCGRDMAVKDENPEIE